MISLFHFAFYLLFLLLTIQHSTSFSFNYNFSDPTFDQSVLRLEGDAFLDGDIINLSRYNADDNFDHSQGRATYKQPILLWDPSTGKAANFTTSFTFALRYTVEQPGDGMTFFLLPYPSDLTDRSSQGCLGAVENCYSPNTKRKKHVLAVEFDSYMNDWDPSNSHVGIDVDSISSIVYQNITLSTNTDMRITSNITYDSGTKILTVLVYSDNNVGFGNYSLNAKVDLRSLLPSEVAIGFSGATGHARYVELHQIFNWYFNSTLEPKNISSLGSLSNILKVVIGLVTSLFIIVGFGSIIWWKKYKIRSYREVEMYEVMYNELTKQAGPKVFQYDELLVATKNFAEEQKLESPNIRLVEWVWELHGHGKILEAADDRLDGDFEAGQMECLMVVGLWCAHPDDSQRPNIKKAMDALHFESPLPLLPPQMPVPMYAAPLENISILSRSTSISSAMSTIERC
ncbi:L-type lectin-domain containing receptor kinase IX.1-like protein [Carex littledalei]|uniref:L-type lectin-domain containing receptor kinase IX.1-like protein n=1 Tax=Carex littledalei TaxID=544730 RepID=A0A833R2W1_9POAL|nr:L-type lectin-domain containing receptor kinase IX.1-like protein [Carex littledalei]